MTRIGMVILFLTLQAAGDPGAGRWPVPGVWPVDKKLIKVGHAPFPDHIRANIRTMETYPGAKEVALPAPEAFRYTTRIMAKGSIGDGLRGFNRCVRRVMKQWDASAHWR